jgi:hypothetical protein
MPMVRRDIFQWVQDTNTRPIRDQSSAKERGPDHVAGVPNDLYINGPQHGFPPCPEMVKYFESLVSAYGTLSLVI